MSFQTIYNGWIFKYSYKPAIPAKTTGPYEGMYPGEPFEIFNISVTDKLSGEYIDQEEWEALWNRVGTRLTRLFIHNAEKTLEINKSEERYEWK